MSPVKQKKLATALDNLFSSARKPVQPIEEKAVVAIVEAPLQESKAITSAVEAEISSSLAAPKMTPVEASSPAKPPITIETTLAPATEKPIQNLKSEAGPSAPEQMIPTRIAAVNQGDQQLVVFSLAGELFGVDIALVESIIKMQSITELPQTPSYIIGVTNLRGSVLPVIDLRTRFALETRQETRETRIIIVTMGSIKVGMVVDGVSEVLRVPGEAIEALPAMVSSVNSAFLKGIARMETHLIILLEISKVLNINEKQS